MLKSCRDVIPILLATTSHVSEGSLATMTSIARFCDSVMFPIKWEIFGNHISSYRVMRPELSFPVWVSPICAPCDENNVCSPCVPAGNGYRDYDGYQYSRSLRKRRTRGI